MQFPKLPRIEWELPEVNNFESEEVVGYMTPLFDFSKGEFVTDASGAVALDDGQRGIANLIEKIHRAPRGAYRVYTDDYGSELRNVLLDSELGEKGRISRVKEAIRDSLIYDERITDVSEIEITKGEKDAYIASYTVYTIYGDVPVRREVKV
ncbi:MULTISPECIES: DUF2634 domain-containing protein [Bacillus]|uniref:DUF2634 domain-containing protein n=1 Tax=Bacillus TaxID=1386 RepID=UPI0020A05F0F|nr:DUF2634 domain-containing protein [Bacillus sp. 1663tsa1]MCP1180540.1 DUF2634 domain-containing protein [Bacillus sp. 1663tsa1]